jgi:hypothetical protein
MSPNGWRLNETVKAAKCCLYVFIDICYGAAAIKIFIGELILLIAISETNMANIITTNTPPTSASRPSLKDMIVNCVPFNANEPEGIELRHLRNKLGMRGYYPAIPDLKRELQGQCELGILKRRCTQKNKKTIEFWTRLR